MTGFEGCHRSDRLKFARMRRVLAPRFRKGKHDGFGEGGSPLTALTLCGMSGPPVIAFPWHTCQKAADQPFCSLDPIDPRGMPTKNAANNA